VAARPWSWPGSKLRHPMSKLRTGEPWMPAASYGRTLRGLSLNLLVRDLAGSLPFYRDVLGLSVQYSDADFAALSGPDEIRMMLHADHTYDSFPLGERLAQEGRRGTGAEIRLLGLDPDAAERRAREHGAKVLLSTRDYAHGWRACYLEDPDGYTLAVGMPTPP
jgi:catechol 2,3-dioxygenase-like lactoylglutathione lyase family enzyme